MECKCGGTVQTTKDEMDSVSAKKAFPNSFVPDGWVRIVAVHGMCKCTRYMVDFHLIERGFTQKTTQLF